MVWTLAVVAWAAVGLLRPDPARPEETVERIAGLHQDQHQAHSRFYVPTYAKIEKDGTAVLRYQVGDSSDTSVADFLRTYEITAEPKQAGTAEETYRDRFGDVRRTFTITYDQSADVNSAYESPARITVKAEPLKSG
ncbi:hypothetical protein P8605_02075 [Streptomyces sp. T-3]|nr:hypothetical protein [Streptomyces sp. T-3]